LRNQEGAIIKRGGSVICGQELETAMTSEKAQRFVQLTNQLVEALVTATICADEIRAAVRAELDDHSRFRGRLDPFVTASVQQADRQRPLLDQSTLSVMWQGKLLHLGHTLAFRLLDRLARRPQQYVTHLDLLRDVWDDEYVEVATIRSTVRHLRRALRSGGMDDLATAIRGHQGRYVLDL
jgi:DNA-binding response OmpR family regulator